MKTNSLILLCIGALLIAGTCIKGNSLLTSEREQPAATVLSPIVWPQISNALGDFALTTMLHDGQYIFALRVQSVAGDLDSNAELKLSLVNSTEGTIAVAMIPSLFADLNTPPSGLYRAFFEGMTAEVYAQVDSWALEVI